MIHTEETKRKLSEMRRGERNPFYGKKHTPETRVKLAKHLSIFRKNRTYDIRPTSIQIPRYGGLCYLAGIIDGEGSVGFRKGRPFVAVYNTSNELILWLTSRVGGGVVGEGKKPRGRTPCYQWSIGAARDVYSLCLSLRPHLIIKQNACDAVINYLKDKYGSRL